jgi:hypothetical protein
LVVAFSLERLIAVYFPLKLTTICSKNKTHAILIGLILFALAFYSFSFFTSGIELNKYESKCVTFENSFNSVRIMAMTDIVITSISPFFLISIINLLIGFRLKRKSSYDNKHYSKRNHISSLSVRNRVDLNSVKKEKLPNQTFRTVNPAYKKSVKFNDVSLAVSYKKDSNVSFLIRKSTQVKRTKEYSEATRTLFLISLVFLILNCPMAFNKTFYFLNENLIIKTSVFNQEEFIIYNSTLNVTESINHLETSESEEIFERVTCYMFYLNFSLNFFLYNSKSKFRNIILRKIRIKMKKWF